MKLPAQQPPATLPPGCPAKEGLRRAAGLDGALSWPVWFGKTRTPPAGPRPRRPMVSAGEGGGPCRRRSGKRGKALPYDEAGVDRYTTYRLGGMRDPRPSPAGSDEQMFGSEQQVHGR